MIFSEESKATATILFSNVSFGKPKLKLVKTVKMESTFTKIDGAFLKTVMSSLREPEIPLLPPPKKHQQGSLSIETLLPKKLGNFQPAFPFTATKLYLSGKF